MQTGFSDKKLHYMLICQTPYFWNNKKTKNKKQKKNRENYFKLPSAEIVSSILCVNLTVNSFISVASAKDVVRLQDIQNKCKTNKLFTCVSKQRHPGLNPPLEQPNVQWVCANICDKTAPKRFYSFLPSTKPHYNNRGFVCLCWGFTAQSTQCGHVERGQFTLPHVYWAGLVL